MDALDRWITQGPDEPETISRTDWQGEEMVIGWTYIEIEGEWVHEDEIHDYIDDCQRITVEEGDLP